MCEHLQFQSVVNVTRLTDSKGKITGFTTSINVRCRDCGLPFEWKGLPAGYSPHEPMVNFDGTELRAPIQPMEIIAHTEVHSLLG